MKKIADDLKKEARSLASAIPPAAQTAWGAVGSSLDKAGQAFGLPARLP